MSTYKEMIFIEFKGKFNPLQNVEKVLQMATGYLFNTENLIILKVNNDGPRIVGIVFRDPEFFKHFKTQNLNVRPRFHGGVSVQCFKSLTLQQLTDFHGTALVLRWRLPGARINLACKWLEEKIEQLNYRKFKLNTNNKSSKKVGTRTKIGKAKTNIKSKSKILN